VSNFSAEQMSRVSKYDEIASLQSRLLDVSSE